MSDDAFDRKLDALRHEIAGLEPPPSIGQAIAAAVRAASRKAQPRVWHGRWRERWPVWPAAVAVTIGIVAWALQAQLGSELPPRPAGEQAPAATEFIPLVPIRDIASDHGAYVVATQMPRMMLSDFGLPVNPARAADTISSELLIRRDGTVLAVRFID
jgi:hypothetical protein